MLATFAALAHLNQISTLTAAAQQHKRQALPPPQELMQRLLQLATLAPQPPDPATSQQLLAMLPRLAQQQPEIGRVVAWQPQAAAHHSLPQHLPLLQHRLQHRNVHGIKNHR